MGGGGLCNPHQIQDHWLKRKKPKLSFFLFCHLCPLVGFFLILLKTGPRLTLNINQGTLVCHTDDKMESLDPLWHHASGNWTTPWWLYSVLFCSSESWALCWELLPCFKTSICVWIHPGNISIMYYTRLCIWVLWGVTKSKRYLTSLGL